MGITLNNATKQAIQVLEKAKISKAPIDVELIAELNGANVVYSPLEDEHCGMIYIDDDEVIIGVNSLHHPNRRRFTIAHEIGHLAMHKDKLAEGAHIDKWFRLNRNKKSSDGTEIIEIEANQFAAELLMPTHLLEKDIDSFDVEEDESISKLAEKYEVSKQAMALKIAKILSNY